jgi:hypothetical protein
VTTTKRSLQHDGQEQRRHTRQNCDQPFAGIACELNTPGHYLFMSDLGAKNPRGHHTEDGLTALPWPLPAYVSSMVQIS